jgi:hypothetical protein
MKKMILAGIAVLLLYSLFLIAPVAAEESNLYYVNVPILKIFPYKLGYYVIYRRSGLKTGEAYIPKGWFSPGDQRAILNQTDPGIEPYMTIVTDKGQFDYVQLVVAKDLNNPTWGNLSPGTPIEDKFKIDKLSLEY